MAAPVSTPQDARKPPSVSGPAYDPRGGGASRGGGPRTPWTVYLRTGRTAALISPFRFAIEETAIGFRDGLVDAFLGHKAKAHARKSNEYRHGYKTGYAEALEDIRRCGPIPIPKRKRKVT
jgi:hypothetical protein